MKIRVTKKHIQDGVQNSKCACPVALAMKEYFGFDAFEDADVGQVYLSISNFVLTERVPSSVRKFIKQFDEGKPVKPFTFEL